MSITTELQRIAQAKTDIKTAIISKEVEVAETETIDTYASKVDAVYTKGYEKGKAEGGGGDTSLLDSLINRKIPSIENSTVTTIGSNAFQNCSKLSTANFTQVTTVGANAVNGCTSLTKIEFSKSPTFNTLALANCSSLEIFIIRGEQVARATSNNILNATPISNGTGYIYVPDNLVDDYKSATNWSTFASQIKGLSELEAITE